MKLTLLNPKWIRYETRPTEVDMIVGPHETWRARGCPTEHKVEDREHIIFVDRIEDAQGIWYDCPKCHPNGHGISTSFEGRGLRPDQGTHNRAGQPVRWTVTGNSFDNLTLAPSILVEGGCEWHGFIQNGEAA